MQHPLLLGDTVEFNGKPVVVDHIDYELMKIEFLLGDNRIVKDLREFI